MTIFVTVYDDEKKRLMQELVTVERGELVSEGSELPTMTSVGLALMGAAKKVKEI